MKSIMRKRSWFKRIVYLLLAAIVTMVLVILICNGIIVHTAKGKLYDDVNSIPPHKTGILLGTSKYLSNGAVNPYYAYRIEAATALLRQGKIRYVVVSGDNTRPDYNEPKLMREDLIRGGIDSNRIFLDYAGIRTFDSMVRLKEIFGQDSAISISQPFHNERAIYLGEKAGLAVVGFNAKDVDGAAGRKVMWREKLARVKVFIDGLTNKRPKFGGEKIVLPE